MQSAKPFGWIAAIASCLAIAIQTVSAQHAVGPPILVPQTGHSGAVLSVALSPNGAWLATGSADNSIIIWDAATTSQIRTLLPHAGSVFSLAVSPDGRWLVSVDKDSVDVWDVAKGKKGISSPCANCVNAAFLPDGRTLLIGARDGIRVYDFFSGKPGGVVRGVDPAFGFVVSRSNGFVVAAGSAPMDGGEAAIKVWDSAGWRLVRSVEVPGLIKDIALSSDDSLLVVLVVHKNEHKLIAFETSTWRELTSFAIEHKPSFVFVSPDKNLFGTEGSVEDIKLWDAKTGRQKGLLRAADHFAKGVFSQDGSRLIVARDLLTVDIWDANAWKALASFTGRAHIGHSLALSPSGRSLAVAGSTIDLWNLEADLQRFAVTERAREVAIPEFVPVAGSSSPATLPDTGGVRVTRGGKEIGKLDEEALAKLKAAVLMHPNIPPIGALGQTRGIALSRDGRWLASTGSDGGKDIMKLWDVTTGRVLYEVPTYFPSWGIAFSPDNEAIATSDSGAIRLWHRASGKLSKTISQGEVGMAFDLEFSSDGSRLASAEHSRGQLLVRIVEPATGRVVQRIVASDSSSGGLDSDGVRSNSLALNGSGTLVVAGNWDGVVGVWEVSTARQVRSWAERNSGQPIGVATAVNAVAFSPSGRNVAWVSGGSAIKIADIVTGNVISVLRGHADRVMDLKFGPDGRWLVSTSADGTIRFWDSRSEIEIVSLQRLRDGGWLAVSADGRFDTDNVEAASRISWVVPDDPFQALPVDIFMRDYFEPGLVSKLLAGVSLPPIAGLSSLNRARPTVRVAKVEQVNGRPDEVRVTVQVTSTSRRIPSGGRDINVASGAYDLRFFRNGQLVGQWPNAVSSDHTLAEWRKTHAIPLDASGRSEMSFVVRLPRVGGPDTTVFSAYAFNTDRVKSATHELRYTRAATPAGPRRAYVIAIGVGQNQDTDLQLTFARSDAVAVLSFFAAALARTREFEQVVQIPLVTPPPPGPFSAPEPSSGFILPTKANVRTVLDLLAGRVVEPTRRHQLPDSLVHLLRRAEPQDLVLLAVSSHGMNDPQGSEFFLLPFDIGDVAGPVVSPDQLSRAISSEELAAWLRGIDAGSITMILATCYSQSAVNRAGFKPGPMGDAGLGQLAYDRGMQILAAAQSDALAIRGLSLLSHALVVEGPRALGGASEQRLTDLLQFAMRRVPSLFSEMPSSGRVNASVQDPRLFDYRKTREDVVVLR